MPSTSDQGLETLPSTARNRAARLIAYGLCLAVCGVFLYVLVGALLNRWNHPTTFDDAYVFCRYADHFLAGYGFSWNPGGPQTYGCTSLLYLFWITLLRYLTDLPVGRILAVGSWLPAFLFLFACGIACSRTAPPTLARRSIVGIAFVSLCAYLQSHFLFHVETGMDTTLGIFTNGLLILVTVYSAGIHTTRRILLIAFIGYLSVLARPENIIFSAMFPVMILWSDADHTKRRRLILFYCIFFAGFLLIDAFIKTLAFGSPLPIPYYVKKLDFYKGYIGSANLDPFRMTKMFLTDLWLPLAIIILFIQRESIRLAGICIIPCMIAIGFFFTVAQIMGYGGRFYYPMSPFIIVAAYHVLAMRFRNAESIRKLLSFRLLVGRALVIGLGLILLYPVTSYAMVQWKKHRSRKHPVEYAPYQYRPSRSAPLLSRMRSIHAISALMRGISSDVVWAMSEHGLISSLSPNVKIIDMVGLHDRNTLSGKPIIDHVLENRPDIIWFTHPYYTGLINALLTHPSFDEQYDYWPRAFMYGLAVRKDSRYKNEIVGNMQQLWRTFYQMDMPPPSIRIH